MQDPESILSDLSIAYPGIKIVEKSSSRFMRLLDKLLRIISFGRINTFMTEYTTTIGLTIYTPTEFSGYSPARRAVTLLHEAVHVDQSRRFTPVLFAFLYLLFPVPILFAYFRTRFEKEAYEVTIRQSAKFYGVDLVKTHLFRQYILDQFTGPAYLYMWVHRSSIESWFDSIIASLEGA